MINTLRRDGTDVDAETPLLSTAGLYIYSKYVCVCVCEKKYSIAKKKKTRRPVLERVWLWYSVVSQT